MIRINLLGVASEALKAMAVPEGAGAGAAVVEKVKGLEKLMGPIAGVVFLIGAAYIGLTWVRNNGELDRLGREIAEETQRKQHLAEVQAKAKEFESKKTELESKIKVITSLKENQQTPVFIMDELSARLDDHVWFEDMKLKGRGLEIKAKAFTLTAMTNFLKNFTASPYVATYSLKRAADQRGVVSFEIICTLKGVRPDRLDAKPVEAAPPKGGGGKKK
jgi:Tfp pilus assembly protein PilN